MRIARILEALEKIYQFKFEVFFPFLKKVPDDRFKGLITLARIISRYQLGFRKLTEN